MGKLKKILYWSPRIITILFIIFISLFALDVFSERYGFFDTIVALLIHLIPTYILITALLTAWRWPIVGGFIFIILGIFYIVWVWNKQPIIAYFLISGPAFLIGLLFIIGHKIKKPAKTASMEK